MTTTAAVAPIAAPAPMKDKLLGFLPTQKLSAAVRFTMLMWFIVLLEPHWFLARKVAGVFTKIPTPLYGVLLIVVLSKKPKSWYPPLLAFILYTILLIPFAYVRGEAISIAKQLIAYYVVALAAVAVLKTAKLAVPIIATQMLYAYLYWGILGIKGGRVPWHPALANYDAFGPLMVIGIGSCYYYGLATRVKKEKLLANLGAMLCVVGLVSSFARGAVIAGVAVMGWLWVRSKSKVKTTAFAALGAVGVVIAAAVIGAGTKGRSETGNSFFTEMMTLSAGSSDGTVSDREVLWNLATRVWMQHPLLGVGANNFGAYAADHFRVGETGGGYDDNPQRLWGRQLHSTYYQLLCEYGLVGCGIFAWILVDFWQRNRALRRKTFRETWAERSGGRLDVGQLSYGLECAMIGFLTTGMFYNQIFDEHWFYTIIAINTLLYYHSKPPATVKMRSVPAPHATR